MDAFDVVFIGRSIRKCKKKIILDGLLNDIFRAAFNAPSVEDLQP